MRTFDTGASRDDSDWKLDYSGFFSPLAAQMEARYMQKHRVQDGVLRNSDNWKRGLPIEESRKSLARHHQDLQAILDGYFVYDCYDSNGKSYDHLILAKEIKNLPITYKQVTLEDTLCAVSFNCRSMLHELAMERENKEDVIESIPHPPDEGTDGAE